MKIFELYWSGEGENIFNKTSPENNPARTAVCSFPAVKRQLIKLRLKYH